MDTRHVARARFLVTASTACLVLAISAAARAATYQVGPGKMYATLGAVAERLAAGDIVEVDGNNTYAGDVLLTKSGTATAKITIRGVRIGGKQPVLSGGTNTIEVQGSHLVLEGFELTGGSFRCFYHHGDDITLRDAVIHDCPKHGLLGADTGSGSLLLEYVELFKCGGGTQDHQIYMATDEQAHPGSVFRMQHCFVHDGNGGNNVKSRAERNEIYYNWLEGAFYHELELIGPDPAGGSAENLKREDSDVVGNVLWQKNTFSVTRFGGDGTGQTNGRYRFVNNTVIVQPNGGAVFRLFDGIESVEMHNNVFFGVGGASVNVKREVEAVWSTRGSIIGGTNNWVASGATFVPTEWMGTIGGTDPGLVSMTAPDLRPTASSPLIDKGNPMPASPTDHAFVNPLMPPAWHPPMHALAAVGTAQARPARGTLDIGAFEYASALADGGPSDDGGSGGSTGVSGGAGSGGASPTGAGGTAGSGGLQGSSTGASGGSRAMSVGSSDAQGNCSCRAINSSKSRGTALAFFLAAASLVARRRRRI